ncbi:BF3164 family lipoprotein [Proteiniphilum sp.]|uniref:BF3164 family lipoprotein n=1 Tax=Proteiniphilum sp. TaxID=1926877 RepID=UPI002B203489|nr:BF3164 family lipoprotein [Proteiniphilum sp.]MEA4918104.1 BF3164 family lipoprotein [Proteiniphilum sp.]
MKTRLLIIIMLVFFQMGCNKQIKDNFLSQRQFLSGELINVDCLIGKPYRLILHDTLLFVCDPYESNTLTVLNLLNNQCDDRILQIGNGPGEVSGPLKLSLSATRNKLYVFQIQSGILSTYNISGRDLTLVESVRIEERPANVVITEEALVGIGLFDEGRYHIYDRQGILINHAGAYPSGEMDNNAHARFFLYQGDLCSQPEGTHFALGSSYSDNLEFYKIKEGQTELLKKYGTGDKVQARFDNTIQLDDNCVLGYKSSYATDKYCYMLYSGKTYAENNRRVSWGENIFVFEWNGNFVKSFRLSREVLTFAVDETNGIIYGIVLQEGEAAIMKFKI